MSARDTIPRFEPEVVEAEARRRWRGDDEKVATTAVKELAVRGVRITSRYQKAYELELMGRIIDAMPPCVSAQIESVWCDSKACHCYSITLKPSAGHARVEETAAVAAALFSNLALELHGGHNGIVVLGPGGEYPALADADPDWRDDYLDDLL